MIDSIKFSIKMAQKYVDSITKSDSGETPVKALVMLFVIAILAGALLPVGINSLKTGSNSTGNWSASETATYGIIAIMVIITVVLLLVRIATE